MHIQPVSGNMLMLLERSMEMFMAVLRGEWGPLVPVDLQYTILHAVSNTVVNAVLHVTDLLEEVMNQHGVMLNFFVSDSQRRRYGRITREAARSV